MLIYGHTANLSMFENKWFFVWLKTSLIAYIYLPKLAVVHFWSLKKQIYENLPLETLEYVKSAQNYQVWRPPTRPRVHIFKRVLLVGLVGPSLRKCYLFLFFKHVKPLLQISVAIRSHLWVKTVSNKKMPSKCLNKIHILAPSCHFLFGHNIISPK